MKVIELADFGLTGLRSTEREESMPGEDEVLLQLCAASLNYRDLEILEGRYAVPVSLPVVPLSDAVAEVVAVGAQVHNLRVGDRVCPLFFPDWRDGPFEARFLARQPGANIDGVLRERMVLPAGAVARAPAHLGAEAATLPIAALTAWCALTDAEVGPGRRVLVLGTGGVSLFALQLARLFGAEVLLVGRGEARLARATALGADVVIDRDAHPDWGERVATLSNGEGVDLVVDVAGAATLPHLLAALRVGGAVAMVGYASGAELRFDMRALFIGRRARLHGHAVGSRKQFEAMCRAIEQHRLVPAVDRRFAFEEVRAAYERLNSGQAFGKVLVTV